jgi:hypothetical protein
MVFEPTWLAASGAIVWLRASAQTYITKHAYARMINKKVT